MRHGNSKYNSVLAKIRAQYDCEMGECLDHAEYLKAILEEVYKHEYDAVLDDISMETERLDDMDKFKTEFFKFMKS